MTESHSTVCRKEPFGSYSEPHGDTAKACDLYTLKNANGAILKVTNYGGTIVRIDVPDRNGVLDNVTLGFDDLDSYTKHGMLYNPYFGALIGRFGNRIAGGKFQLDDKEYNVTINHGAHDVPSSLHGGSHGFNQMYWKITAIGENDASMDFTNDWVFIQGLRLEYTSKDGEEGYPGNYTVIVKYIWGTSGNDQQILHITYEATTDAPTVHNLTQHTYFNLGGGRSGRDILDHQMRLHADQYLPIKKGLIPTGILEDVDQSPFDFRCEKMHTIGERVNQNHPQLALAEGYDHCYVLSKSGSGKLQTAALIRDPRTGRSLKIETTEPGIQFYSGNFLGHESKDYPFTERTGFALECQHFPDSPNQPMFPPTILRPGENFRSETRWTFSTSTE